MIKTKAASKNRSVAAFFPRFGRQKNADQENGRQQSGREPGGTRKRKRQSRQNGKYPQRGGQSLRESGSLPGRRNLQPEIIKGKQSRKKKSGKNVRMRKRPVSPQKLPPPARTLEAPPTSGPISGSPKNFNPNPP